MPDIDISSIMGKVTAWSKSDAGKKRMDAVVHEYRKSGVNRTGGGTDIITVRQMEAMTQNFIDMLTQCASMCMLPASVMEHFESLTHTKLTYRKKEQTYSTRVFFEDAKHGDMKRKSLKKINQPGRTGEGVRDIVGLFNTGYPTDGRMAIHPVHGIWERHGETFSRDYRPPLHFIENAINDFNVRYRNIGAWAEYYNGVGGGE